MKLTGKEIVLGVTGGIAAYKSAEVVSRLRKQGAQVHVIMTENATKFVAPLTFETLSNHPVVTDTFARPDTWEVEHIALAKRAELFAIAPATANILAKLAWGLADDMLSTTALATRAPMLVAPAMNVGSVGEAARRPGRTWPPCGSAACMWQGRGAVSWPAGTAAQGAWQSRRRSSRPGVEDILCPRQDYAGLRVLVTAGATRRAAGPRALPE